MPWEGRIGQSNTRKEDRYMELTMDLQQKGYKVWYFAFEIGARGMVGQSTYTILREIGLTSIVRSRALAHMSRAAEEASQWIWSKRDWKWSHSIAVLVQKRSWSISLTNGIAPLASQSESSHSFASQPIGELSMESPVKSAQRRWSTNGRASNTSLLASPNKAYISSMLCLRWWFRRSLKMLAGACRTWFDTARRLDDIDWYWYNTGKDTRLINVCERIQGPKEGVSSLRIPARAWKEFQLLLLLLLLIIIVIIVINIIISIVNINCNTSEQWRTSTRSSIRGQC